MSRTIITEGYLSDIGDALREQLGTDQTFLPSEMGPYIRSIQMSASGVYECYVVGSTPYASGWLSTESGGAAITPSSGKLYMIVSESHKDEAYRWNGSAYELVSPSLATQTEAETGTENTKYMSPLRTSQAISERIDSALDQSSSNAIANSAVKTALDQKANTSSVPTKTSDLTNDSSFVSDSSYVHTDSNFTASEKSKLSGIESEANKTIIDASLSASSSNPVQNSVIKSALDLKADLDSPALAGTPTAPTATAGTNTTQIATTEFVQQEISANAYELPLMSADTRGGAKLGDGLAVDDGTLHVGQLAKASTGEVYGPLASVTAKGHAEQVATTGKNLLPNNATTRTVNGVTFTVNADGSVTCDGTATASIWYKIVDNLTLNAGTYVISGEPESSPRGLYYSDDGTFGGIPTSDVITLSEQTTGVIYIRVLADTAVSNLTFYPQLELGSTATEYEPYTGGAPSPSPDYPQEIQVVRGRNLLDYDGGTFTSANNHRIVSLTGVPAKAGETYAISFDYSRVDSSDWRVYAVLSSSASVSQGNNDAGQIAFLTHTSTNGHNTIIYTPTQDGYLYVNVGGQGNTLSNLQIELGSVATPYVPYGHVGLEAQGKNLLDGNTESVTMASSGSFYPYRATKLQAGKTYTVSFASSINSGAWQAIANNAAGTGGQTILATVNFATAKTATFTPVQDFSYFMLFSNTGGTFEGIQLELGSTATDYEPYFHHTTPIPLPERGWVAGLPDGTSDILSIDSAGKVEWKKQTEEVVLDNASQYWTGYDSSYDGHSMELPNLLFNDTNPSKQALSDRFVVATSRGNVATSVPTIKSYSSTTSNTRMLLCGTGETTQGGLTTWLSTQPVTVLYPLVTPAIEECGYVDLPDIPASAQVSIPELEDFGCTFWVDESGTIHAAMKQWYDRAHSEYADRIAALESAVADLVTGA